MKTIRSNDKPKVINLKKAYKILAKVKKHIADVSKLSDKRLIAKTGMFKKAFPDRFFDCGIAENNMVGVAAGLALTGKIPFASSFAESRHILL
mgnify:CR=1 FL=1